MELGAIFRRDRSKLTLNRAPQQHKLSLICFRSVPSFRIFLEPEGQGIGFDDQFPDKSFLFRDFHLLDLVEFSRCTNLSQSTFGRA